ncbi:MAG: DUF2974 domain-containing protein [Eggerthellaceae bacterium]|nr:DUF2974 domain-containing protein [Eggerthellaceae bacterium]
MDHTIVEYLEEQRASFSDVPLNDVDSLVLSTISYFRFERGVIGRIVPTELIPLPVAICGIAHTDLYGNIWLSHERGDEFLAALLSSPRFMDLKVGYFINEVSNHFEKQFSAITFFFPDGSAYVAFRGTDNTLAGWKENFNLTFMSELPSQISARTYVEDIADTGVQRLYVGGHSKGGNPAEYSALTCRDQTFDKIVRVFNHDGPGFAFKPSERIDTPEYEAKLHKTVPESSVFGMLMESRSNYRVVRSLGKLFAQHAATHWVVENDDFVTLDAISPEAAIISGTLNNWAKSYDLEKRGMFIDAVYEIVCAANADTWAQFAEDGAGSARAVAEATAKLPADMRATLFRMLRDIAPIMGAEAAKQALDKIPGLRD